MDYYLKLVEGCDAIIFSRVDGMIRAGVGKEVNSAIERGKPAFELAAGGEVRRITEPVTYLTV